MSKDYKQAYIDMLNKGIKYLDWRFEKSEKSACDKLDFLIPRKRLLSLLKTKLSNDLNNAMLSTTFPNPIPVRGDSNGIRIINENILSMCELTHNGLRHHMAEFEKKVSKEKSEGISPIEDLEKLIEMENVIHSLGFAITCFSEHQDHPQTLHVINKGFDLIFKEKGIL